MNKLNAESRLLTAGLPIEERLARLENRREGDGLMTPQTSRHEDTAIEEQLDTPMHPVDNMDVQCEEPLPVVAKPLSQQVQVMDQKLQQQDQADAEFQAKEGEKKAKANQKARLGASAEGHPISEWDVHLPVSYNEDDGTMNIRVLSVIARGAEEAVEFAEAKWKFMQASPVQPVKAGRGTGFGAGVLLMAADTGRIFLAKRSSKGDEGGTWCCGGGGVEDYETIEEAARRENMEELGFDLKGVQLLHMHRSVQPGFIFHNHMAVIPHELEARLNDEHSECGWFSDLPEPMHPKLMEAINTWAAAHADNELVKQAQAEEMASKMGKANQ